MEASKPERCAFRIRGNSFFRNATADGPFQKLHVDMLPGISASESEIFPAA